LNIAVFDAAKDAAMELDLPRLPRLIHTLDHYTLLSILQARFSDSVHSLVWFHSYLTNRLHTFITASSQTCPLSLSSGAKIGPTTFLTYTEGTTDIFFAHSLLYHLRYDTIR